MKSKGRSAAGRWFTPPFHAAVRALFAQRLRGSAAAAASGRKSDGAEPHRLS